LIFIDAQTGAVLEDLPLLQHTNTPAQGAARYQTSLVDINTERFVNGAGDTLYRLRDLPRNIWLRDALSLQSNPDVDVVHHSTLWDQAQHRTPVAAHWGMATWFDYLLEEHNWRGFANDSSALYGWVHLDHQLNNAFWNGSWVNFGDGDGLRYGPFVSLDVVAHECTHGLVQNACGLLYVGEPGALNEGICDIFGSLVEAYAFPDPGAWNWMMGEKIAYLNPSNGIRRLDLPNATNAPAAFGGKYWANTAGCAPNVNNDQCGIHTNCTVLGRFFYLLATGETGWNEFGTAYDVAPIGLKKAAEILFEVVTGGYLLPTDGFAEMREATIEAAAQLYPGTEKSVAQAWGAVGVGGCGLAVTDSIQLLTPNLYVTYQYGAPINIAWTATPGIKKLRLEFSANDGASWQQVSTTPLDAAAGSYTLAAPQLFSKICRLRLVDADKPLVYDRTDTTFEITGCALQAHFSTAVSTVCFGQPFLAANDSPDKTADFQWRWNGTDFPAADSLLEIPAMNIPGDNTIELIAETAAGCRDTFARTVRVRQPLTPAFSYETHGSTLVANAHYPGADTYIWLYGGQKVGGNAPALTLYGLAPGTDSLRLVVLQQDCPGGVAAAAVEVTVSAGVVCVGNQTTFQQVTHTNNIVGIAERGNKLYLAMPGCGMELDKTSQATRMFKPENTGGLLSLPLTSVTVRNDGKVWFGSEACGIGVYDPADASWERISNFNWLPGNLIEKMETDSAGNTWLLTKPDNFRQLVKITATGQVFYFPAFYYAVNAWAVVGDELWLCSSQGTNYIKKARLENGVGIIEDVTEPAILQNTYFRTMGSNGKKLWLWHLNTYTFTEVDLETGGSIIYNSTNSNLPSTGISFDQIIDDREGGAWMYYNRKPYHYDGAGDFTMIDVPAFLNAWSHHLIFLDSGKTLWIGTQSGLGKYANNNGTLIDLSTNGFKITTGTRTQISDIHAMPGGNRTVVSQYSNFFETTDGTAQPIAPGCS
ncbi:MAG: M4 family metallopeptidase, partial [Saprospiraceae bacterium]|nr:M4 family metallopeptidase [Saprospiraceae bacterium]